MSSSPTSPSSRRVSLTQLPLPSAARVPSPKPSPPIAGPSSPTRTSFTGSRTTPRTAYNPSSTHASGILPSANFFRPSRPNQQPQVYRSSAASEDDPQDSDVFPMASLTKQVTSSSEDGQGVAGHLDDTLDESQFPKKKSKKGQEPLLPLARPSISRERSTATTTSKSAKNMVRNSLDRVFNLSRGMSVDSLHRPSQSQSQRAAPEHSIDEMDGKFQDEEAGIYEGNRQSFHRRKDSSDMGHTALDVTRGPSFARSLSVHSEFSFVPDLPSDPKKQLWEVPWLHPDNGSTVRNYQRHPSNNKFFLQGLILTGGDSPWAFIGAFTILLSIAGVWFGTTAVWWWKNESPAVAAIGAYFALLTITTMFTTAFSDPGILPRNLDPDPPFPLNSPSDGGPRLPMPRDLKVRSDVVRVKYCHTCCTYRPPRSSHCKMCDNCVEGCDHHCQWVNNCIGHRNYTTFFVLLTCATTTLILIIITTALHLYLMASKDHLSFAHALQKGAGSAVAFCMSIIVIWPVSALLTYHVRLLLLNITTIEQIRNQAHKTLVPGPAPPNPFSHGSKWKNLVAVLCRAPGFSYMNFHGIAMHDARKVNPANSDDAGDESRS